MLQLRRPPRSFVIFLILVVGIGALIGHAINALGLAAFCFFVACIEAKPAWKFWYGKQGSQYEGGKGWRFNSWQRVDVTDPKELRRLPDLKN
jgi:hypothetical protein